MKPDNILNFRLIFVLAVLVAVVPLPSMKAAAPADHPPLTDQQKRGENVYLQHCSVCHAAKLEKPKTLASFGPSLSGVVKDGNPEQEKAIRQIIMTGGPNMPGFQYGLDPKEVDDLIAYLKTL